MNADECRQVIRYMDGCIEHYRVLVQFETEKLQHIVNDEVDTLISSLSREEMMVMKSASLEKNRLKLFSELGLRDKTYAELVALAPDELSPQMKTQQKEFTALILELKRVNAAISEIVKDKLQKISAHLRKNGGPAAEQQLYTGAGKKSGAAAGGIFNNA